MGIFKKDPTSTMEWRTSGTFGTEWRFVTSPIPYVQMDLTFQLARFAMFEGGAGSTSGDIVLDFSQLQCLMTASTNDRTGDLDLTFEEPEMTGVLTKDTNDISLTFEALDAVFHPGARMDCNFLEMQFVCKLSGNDMELVFQPMEFQAQSYQGEMMNEIDLVFKELDMFATGRNTYNFMSLTFMRPTIEMKTGHYMELEFERMEAELTGIAGITGSINLRMRPLDIQIVGGPPPYIDLVFMPMGIEIDGDNENIAHLVLNMEYPLLEMTGENDLVGNLDLTMQPMRMAMSQDLVHPVGSLSCSMQPMSFRMTSIQGITGVLTGKLLKMILDMHAYTDGINDIVLEIPELELEMTSDVGDTGSCAVADTLEFGD